MRPWAYTMRAPYVAEGQASMIRHLLPVGSTTPSDFDWTQHTDAIEDNPRRCANSSTAVVHGAAHSVREVMLGSASPAEPRWLRTQQPRAGSLSA